MSAHTYQHVLQAREPWDLIGIDLMGPFPQTPRGCKYILTATCLFSKWVEAEPIMDKSSESVFEVLLNIFERWGLPRRIITDQGKEFNNQVSKYTSNSLPYTCIKHVLSINIPSCC